jgi:hypothetical protein
MKYIAYAILNALAPSNTAVSPYFPPYMFNRTTKMTTTEKHEYIEQKRTRFYFFFKNWSIQDIYQR